MLTTALIVAASLSPAPQGPVGGVELLAPRQQLGYPSAAAAFAPFVDANGLPQRTATLAAGLAEFDGDGNAESWFLGAGGVLTAMMPETGDLGRYRPYTRRTGTAFADAVRFRRAGMPTDLVLLADPAGSTLSTLFYIPSFLDPRVGTWVVQPTLWLAPNGVDELDALDADGDGDDDLVVRSDIHAGSTFVGTMLEVWHFGRSQGYHDIDLVSSIGLPVPAALIRAADLDGDQRTDLVAHVPGAGIVGFRADGNGALLVHEFLWLGAMPVRDLAVADLDGDGRDDVLAALDPGVIVLRSTPGGFAATALLVDPATAPLAGVAAIDVDGDRDLDVVALPSHGRSVAMFRQDAAGGFAPPRILYPPAEPALFGGNTSVAGISHCVGDVDRDGDRDLLLQAPTGAHWLSLTAGTHNFTPVQLSFAAVGLPSPAGFQRYDCTVTMPLELFAAGYTEVEFAICIDNPFNGDRVFWTRSILHPDPLTGVVVVPLQLMLDPLNRVWLFTQQMTTFGGALTAAGPSSITVHAKSGTRRGASTLAAWDGIGDPQGSAVGARWRVVADPPLPTRDADLLPWD